MIEDMTVRGFGEKTQNDYIRHVKNFTIFLGRSPGQARPEDPRHRRHVLCRAWRPTTRVLERAS
jgi:hypothetical protein